MERTIDSQDALQLEALLLSRAYLYTLFHKLFGGVPDEELFEVLLAKTTADVVEEFSGASNELKALGDFLESLRGADRADLLDSAKDEYTRIFVGPGMLPASPYESPYTGVHDMSLFQQNTLDVRAIYRAGGLRVRREQAVPDDHVSLMCAFAAAQAKLSIQTALSGACADLAHQLRDQRSFAQAHMANWLDVYASSVRNSKAGAKAVLYPQMIEALAAFARADIEFLAEAAYWVEQGGQMGEPHELASELQGAQAELGKLERVRPLGIQDNELVSVS